MNKYLQLSFDIIIKKPILYLSIVLQLFFSIFFALDSVNYLSSSLYTDYFCFPLTLKPFICNMPINSELYAGQIDNNYLPETSDFDYSKLVKIESISKACSFIMYDQYGNNYEIRAYSSDITDNLNIKLKKEFNCPESNQYIKGLTSLQNCKGDNLTLYLYDKSAELNIKFSGIVEAPYYYIDNSCINAQGSFSDIFKFTSQNELTFFNYEIIWVNYDDIAQFINQNELDTTKDSLAYNEFIFLKSDITQEEIEINEKELHKNGYTFTNKTAFDTKRIRYYIQSEIVPIMCIVIISILGVISSFIVGISTAKRCFKILYSCGTEKKQLHKIISVLSVLLIFASNMPIILINFITPFINVFNWDISFIKYNFIYSLFIDTLVFIIFKIISRFFIRKWFCEVKND